MTDERYTQGVCEDGAAILCDGQQLDIETILYRLRALDQMTEENACLHQQLSTAHSRLLDMMQGDDGQAWKEARRYFEQHAPEALAQWRGELREPVAERGEPLLARHQPCGCIVCVCETDYRCLGCGATSCGTHPYDSIPNPVYEGAPPTQSAAPEGMVEIHDKILVLSGYPDSYPMPAMKSHLGDIQRALSDLLSAAPSAGEAQGDPVSRFCAKSPEHDRLYREEMAKVDAAEDGARVDPLLQARRDLAFSCGGSLLYNDDGELQLSVRLPHIDFLRDSFSEIGDKLRRHSEAQGDGREARMPSEFENWLRREIPPGTVISDPSWWAPRIWRAAQRGGG